MTYQKKLFSSTIIPKRFYVERSADKQLRDVVANMGRPGYVLVARQMGKTNLLLNAKEELGRDGSFFVYIDLSNPFPDLQQFFRNIIDVAIDSQPCFGEAGEIIYAQRAQNFVRPAHKEHEQELRLLLDATPDRLVICLDEIDALAKADYSDSVFSLIRSTYFSSRINYPQFKKLTYILSGVAEPTEIIKNKDISPFNIGEKIYLDDFTYEEYLAFVTRAGLAFTESVTQRVYYWTSGNPRMCWDICSELENLLVAGESLDEAAVDRSVRKLYLTTFDLAPVDHIRQLATDDREIRSAISNIYRAAFDQITDSQRTKLYLSGIVNADFLAGNLAIKNRVLALSLSEAWISSLGNTRLSLVEAADSKKLAGDYESALKLYKEYTAPGLASNESTLVYYKMGECSLRLGLFSEAIEYFDKTTIRRSEFAGFYFRKILWVGIAQYRLGKIPESISTFGQIIGSSFPDGPSLVYYEALVNICAPYFVSFDENRDRIIENCRTVISAIDEIRALEEPAEMISALMSAAHRNLATAYHRAGEIPLAMKALKASLDFSSVGGRLNAIVQLLGWADDEETVSLLDLAVSYLKDPNTKFSQDALDREANFNSVVYANLIMEACRHGDPEYVRQIVAPLTGAQYGEETVITVFGLLSNYALSRDDRLIAKWIYDIVISFPPTLLRNSHKKQLLFYILLLPHGRRVELENQYIGIVTEEGADSLDELDLRVLYSIANFALKEGKYMRLEAVLATIWAKRDLLAEVAPARLEAMNASWAAIEYLELRLLVARNDKARTKLKAEALRDRLASKLAAPEFFTQEFLAAIRAEVDFVLAQHRSKEPVRHSAPKIGRNTTVSVRYQDGRVASGKYKRFEPDIKSGSCVLEV